ncbi:MAG: pyruvate kinase alpha/beta domain-containing protein [Anaerolineaceae bacterium]|jgi:hypothetical protein|nr:pyruvate kinase alpha/beta domain-containing protein [Anaerolineaceae bacterium]
MPEFTAQTVYFHQPGKANTARTLQLAVERANQLNINTILVATTSGESGKQTAQAFQGKNVITVSHACGYKGPNTQELTRENRAAIEAAGAAILTCQHAFGGVNRALRKQLDTTGPDEIIANTLRIFGEGMKVVAEIAIMAADAGLVQVGEPVLCIAGTGRGADMAAIVLPVNTYAFFDLKILEVICRPALGHPAFD